MVGICIFLFATLPFTYPITCLLMEIIKNPAGGVKRSTNDADVARAFIAALSIVCLLLFVFLSLIILLTTSEESNYSFVIQAMILLTTVSILLCHWTISAPKRRQKMHAILIERTRKEEYLRLEAERKQQRALAEQQRQYERKLIESKISEIDEMVGRQFEEYLAVLFSKMGYHVTVTPATKDHGTDLILKDSKNTIAVQAKRYSSRVGSQALQIAVGGKAYYHASACWVVTNNYFTSAAKEFARESSVVLFDRDWLVEVSTHLQEAERLEKIDLVCAA